MMRTAAAGLLLALAAPIWALEFASTLRPAILYDAPSASAGKLAIVSSGYPLEKVVTTAGWIKVRDATGSLAWVEATALGGKRSLLVSAEAAAVREKPAEDAPTLFRVARSVVLDLLQPAEGGWAKVRHASGQEGYIKIGEVWGL